jgi:tetratricopeptide (TPR) repeat protein
VNEHGALLAKLLSLPTSGRYDAAPLTLEEQKNRTMKTLVALAEGLACKSATLIIVEDLQWADYSTLEFLGLLIEQVRVSPILAVVAYRAGFEPPWSMNPHLTKLRLRHLSRTESIDLINGVTQGRALPSEVLEHILSRTDGVPLFIEELTKLVIDMDLMVAQEDRFELIHPLGQTAIPDSLQDSLMARLDRLGSAKEAAQLASVLGRTFGHALLLAVTSKSEAALDEALIRLVDSELLYRRGLAPEVVYEFKHALVKDAAYQGLLHSKRRQLHREIAQTLENKFPQVTERSPELLSHHYREAGDMEKAVSYSFKAGDDAARRYALTEAAAHYQSSLEMAKGIAVPEEADAAQIRAILKLANVATSREQFERNLGNLGMARTLAEKSDNRVRLCQIQYWTGRTYYVQGRFGLAADLARQALNIAETIDGDDRIRSGPVNLLARVHCLLGEPVAAINHAAESVRQMRESGDHMEEAAVSGVLAFAHAQHGQFDEALAAANHGVTLAQEVGHLPTIAACLMFRGLVHGWFGRLKDATPDFEEGLFVCEQSGDVFRKYLTLGWRGEACLIAGEITAARSSLEECLTLGNTLGTAFHRGAFEAFLAQTMLAEGKACDALRVCDAAVASATQSGETWPRSIALRVASDVQISLEEPDLTAASDNITSAIAIQKERQCNCDLAWSYLVQGRVLGVRGQEAAAKVAFDTAHRLFASLGLKRGLLLVADAQALVGTTSVNAG